MLCERPEGGAGKQPLRACRTSVGLVGQQRERVERALQLYAELVLPAGGLIVGGGQDIAAKAGLAENLPDVVVGRAPCVAGDPNLPRRRRSLPTRVIDQAVRAVEIVVNITVVEGLAG